MSTLLHWVDSYSVGVEELDLQHKKIFSLIGSLRNNLKSSASFRSLLVELQDYSTTHLDREEYYFAKYSYPRKEEHLIFHEEYRQQVADFVERFEKEVAPEEVLVFLEQWWVAHILVEDQEYQEFFNSKGLF